MGFKNETLESQRTRQEHYDWLFANCQPNYYVKVSPDSSRSCGPYKPNTQADNDVSLKRDLLVSEDNHDTIGMVAFDSSGKTAAGTTTNGLKNKIPERVDGLYLRLARRAI